MPHANLATSSAARLVEYRPWHEPNDYLIGHCTVAFASGIVRIELLISVDNPASKRVAERCGYVREGVLRSLHVKQDVREDTEIWSRLVDDP